GPDADPPAGRTLRPARRRADNDRPARAVDGRAGADGRARLPHGRAAAAAPGRQPRRSRPGRRSRTARRRGAVPPGCGRTGGGGRPLHPGRARAAVRARHLAPARLRPRRARRARRHVRHAGSAAEAVARYEGAARIMTPPAWLLVAAAVLALVAGWCANAEAALALVSATGVAERPEHQGRLGTVAADLPRYLSVLLLLRAIVEVLAAVLVTAAFVRWLGDDWRAVLAALAVVIAMRYALTGVRPQTGRVGPRPERTAERAAAFLYPLTRALGPLPGLLVACGNAMPPTRRVRPLVDHEGPADRSELRGLVDYLERRKGIEPGERD